MSEHSYRGEAYIGQNAFVRTEFIVFEGWADLNEWTEHHTHQDDIDSIRVFYGPASMLTVLVVWVRYIRDADWSPVKQFISEIETHELR